MSKRKEENEPREEGEKTERNEERARKKMKIDDEIGEKKVVEYVRGEKEKPLTRGDEGGRDKETIHDVVKGEEIVKTQHTVREEREDNESKEKEESGTVRKTERKLDMEKSGGRKQPKKMKTPSIRKFFSKLSHENKKETVNLERSTNSVGNNRGGLVGNGMDNAKQRDTEAQFVYVSRDNTGCGERRHSSKNNTEQQHVLQQKKNRQRYRVI